MPNRSGKDRLDAIPAAIEKAADFKVRLELAGTDAVRCADLMAEAIEMDRDARSHEIVGRDGRVTFCMERLQACYCLDDARTAYMRARGSNWFNEPKSNPVDGSAE